MSTGICSCGSPSFGNTGRPNCVIEQKVLAFPVIAPRYKKDGSRNTIDLAQDPLTIADSNGDTGNYATIGAYILDRVENTNWDAQDRLYPLPKVENNVVERTETVYETTPSGTKYKIDGVGGVISFSFQLWGKDSVAQIQRELNKFGCSDVDFFYVDIAGAMWGIKDDSSNCVIRGYEISADTWDVFKVWATDTTVNKLSISFDLDNDECVENSYAYTADELGYKATSLKGLISARSISDNTDLTTVVVKVEADNGSACDYYDVAGLTGANFEIANASAPTVGLPNTGAVESPDGTYTVTMSSALVASDSYIVKVTASGYDVASSTFTA